MIIGNSIQLRANKNALGREVCRMCSDGFAELFMQSRLVEYGREDARLIVEVQVPVWECAACSMSYLGEGAEELQHNALCDFMGRLRPSDIVAVRRKADMTQVEFAKELEVGIASLKRWELGTVIQDRRNDRLLRGFASSKETARPRREPLFRKPVDPDTRARAARFKLRIPSAYPAQLSVAA